MKTLVSEWCKPAGMFTVHIFNKTVKRLNVLNCPLSHLEQQNGVIFTITLRNNIQIHKNLHLYEHAKMQSGYELV